MGLPEVEDETRLIVTYGIVEAIRSARGTMVSLNVTDIIEYASKTVPTAREVLERVKRGSRPLAFWLVRNYLITLALAGFIGILPKGRNFTYTITNNSKLWVLAREDPGTAVGFIMNLLDSQGTPGSTGGG